LIAEATDRIAVSPLLGLFVHPQNQRAISVYQRSGFTLFAHTCTDKTTRVVYRSMLYDLRRANP
jgi:ribosomal protein S18 acetylase RimI-like enzyme